MRVWPCPQCHPRPKGHRRARGRALRVPRSHQSVDGDSGMDDEGSAIDEDDGADNAADSDFSVMGISPSKAAFMKNSLDLSQASLMNDSIGSLSDSMDKDDTKDEFDDSDNEKEGVVKVNRQSPQQPVAAATSPSIYRSPLTQQVLIAAAGTATTAATTAADGGRGTKFKLDFNDVTSATPTRCRESCRPAAAASSSDTDAAGDVDWDGPARPGNGGQQHVPGSLRSEQPRRREAKGALLKTQSAGDEASAGSQLQQNRACATVGRNGAAIKAKVFDLPF